MTALRFIPVLRALLQANGLTPQEGGSGPRLVFGKHLITGLPAALIILAVVGILVAFIVRFFGVRRRGRLAHRELQATEAYLQSLFGAMEDAVQVIDRNGTYLRVPLTRAERNYGPP